MRWTAGIPAAVFTALAVLITGPVWLADTQSVIGELDGLDLSGSIWAHWWTADALMRGVSPFLGTHSFVPTGLNPVLQYNLLDAIIHAPLIAGFGTITGYNLAVVLALTATGLSAMHLGRSAGASAAGALLTGCIVQSSSFVALELHCGRISQIFLVFFLLATAQLLRVLGGRQGVGSALLLGGLAAATALVYWYFGIAFLIGATVLLMTHRKAWTPSLGRALGIATVLGLALTLPAVVALLSEWSGLPGVDRTDAAGIIAANSRGLFWPILNTSKAHDHQLGLVTLVLAGLAAHGRVARWKSWLGIAGLGWVLALGPGTAITLPFGWLQAGVPTFDRMWWPYRFELLTVVATGVMAGLGFDRLIKSRTRLWLLGAISLSVLDAPLRSGLLPIMASPLPTTHPTLYAGLDSPIFTVPVMPNRAESERLLLLQTFHGQPTKNGDGEHLLDHMPKAQQAWLESSQMVGMLHTLRRTGSVNATVQPGDIQALLDAGFEWVVVDPSAFEGPKATHSAAAHVQIFERLWGPAFNMTPHGGAWRIKPLASAISVEVTRPTGSERIHRENRK